MAESQSPSQGRSANELPRSFSSTLFSKMFTPPGKRSSKTSTPVATRPPSTPNKRLASTTSNDRKPRKLQRRNRAVKKTAVVGTPATIEATAPASPPSSFYSSTASTVSLSAHSLLDRASLDSLVKSLAKSPPQPLTPRIPTWPTIPILPDRSPQTPTPSGLPRHPLSVLRDPTQLQTYICNIHSLCGSDHRVAERHCVERVNYAGGEVVQRLVPGGFMYTLPPMLENPLQDGERTPLGGHIDVHLQPRFDTQASTSGGAEHEAGEDPPSSHEHVHHEWCDGRRKEVELFSVNSGKARGKSRKWFKKGEAPEMS